MASVCDGIMPKIEEVIMKLNSQSQTLREMEDREAKVRHPSKVVSDFFWQLALMYPYSAPLVHRISTLFDQSRDVCIKPVVFLWNSIFCVLHGLLIVASYHLLRMCLSLNQLATATKDLSSHLQDLQQNMDSLKVEHGQEKSVLAEMQSLLIATMEAQTQRSVSRPVQMVNSEVQTSPGWVERLCVVSEEKRVFQGVRLCGPTETCLLNGPSEPTVGLCCSTKQTNTAYDQTVPSRAALRPLPTNQERQVVQKTADGANESLLPQSFCTQALEPDGDGDTVSGSALQEGIVRYPLRNQVSRSSCILGSIQDESQMMAITARPQDRVMPARQEVMAPNFSVQRGLQKIRPKKRPRGKTRALIPQNALSVYRGVGQGKVFRKLRPDRGEGEEENEELSPLYQVKNKAQCENVKPPKQLKENKPVGLRNDERRHMWSHNTNSTQFMSASDGVDQKTKGKTYAKAKIPKKAQGGLWNLFDFVDSD